jgi:NhaA family Na+:H+ antiporter
VKLQSPAPARHWSATPLVHILGPMQRFVQQEASSGIILLGSTILALLLAHSPLASAYTAVLDTKIGIAIGPLALSESLLHWINDGLMAIFFFVVGLEIKREVLVGELASPRAAALPIVAAIGGVIAPALIYLAFNAGGPAARGWGVPMATDIAFALGCLVLLGDRVPFSLKIFLTAVAIVDDLIAVLVIALFYSGGVQLMALGIGLGLLALLAVANLAGVRGTLVYAGLGVLVWLAFLQSGVHATIAGVLIALTIPARNRIDAPTFLQQARAILDQFERGPDDAPGMLTDELQNSAVIELEEACEHVQAPLQKLEHQLQPWVALMIMPVFALANAGVALSAGIFDSQTAPVALGIGLGLVLGKPVGLLGAVWLATRAKIADLPSGVSWPQMVGASALAGIGFTMSLFIATLAFVDTATLATAKVAILGASVVAGTLGMLLLRQSQAAPAAE